jgi:hypothetical protein
MKKIFISIGVVLFVTISSFVHAQGVGLGIKAGANFANQSISGSAAILQDLNTDAITGFHGGIYVSIDFSEKWGIQPEALYSRVGSELPDVNQLNEFDYLSVPILLRWKPISLLSFEAGPQFSALLSVKDIDGDSIKENFKNSDFGLAAGATLHLPLGFNASLRYVWGFSNVADMEANPDLSEVKNTVFQVSAGWTILGAK